jgi:hypothetical protein
LINFWSLAASRTNSSSAVTDQERPVTVYQSKQREQTMANVERGVVKPPNQQLQGLAATRSAVPPVAVPQLRSPNSALQAGDPGGSANLTRHASAVAPINQRFNVDHARMPQPQSAIEPGRGDIPINPFLASGPGIARAKSIPDDAKQR